MSREPRFGGASFLLLRTAAYGRKRTFKTDRVSEVERPL